MDGVRARHQRRVQRGRHPADQLDARGRSPAGRRSSRAGRSDPSPPDRSRSVMRRRLRAASALRRCAAWTHLAVVRDDRAGDDLVVHVRGERAVLGDQQREQVLDVLGVHLAGVDRHACSAG